MPRSDPVAWRRNRDLGLITLRRGARRSDANLTPDLGSVIGKPAL
jgi:hypothetical protein